jgi:Helix-turn-helix of DDE superfamily endonuclease
MLPFKKLCLEDQALVCLNYWREYRTYFHIASDWEVSEATICRINRALAHRRVAVEHVNRKLKVFRIFSQRYRNRRKRFALRCHLIAGIYNHDLQNAN